MYKKSSKPDRDSDKKPKLSYWSKTKCTCPVCQRDFDKEEMLTGSGRMNAGDLTDELHRTYIPSEKYGAIYPLIYAVGACPRCHLALFWKDFEEIKDKASIEALRDDDENRQKKVATIFPHYELTRERNLLDGAAMYYLALLSYEKVDLAYAPTFKRAMISLRLAWLCGHLNETIPGYNYDYIAKVFYQKANFFYEQTVMNETNRVESFAPVNNFGPDMDKNYGYDGMIYLIGLLEYKYGQTEDMQLRYKKLDEDKRAIARIFGLGKSSKAKPGPLLENARNLYDNISALLKESKTIDLSDDD
ncbi:DUF2225 domain-containing protein [uncultured Treponema sp.]|uniref:DUF2225 domain-containing protein n=1 Tax=uncultured Treponema sp. TaxID=162155 RepID=UPI0025D84E62|nr:DUF2225 domain-containing protein [uncultured Treponema sp.]